MSAKCSPYMYGAPYIFYFVHSIVKMVEMMVQRVDFEQNLKNICPATVYVAYVYFWAFVFGANVTSVGAFVLLSKCLGAFVLEQI